MADCRHYLAGTVELADKIEHAVFHAEKIGIDLATRQHKRVIVVHRHIGDDLVDLYAVTPVILVPALDLAFFQRGNMHGRPGIAQLIARLDQFGLFKAMGCDDENVQTGQILFDSHEIRSFIWAAFAAVSMINRACRLRFRAPAMHARRRSP